MRPDDMDWARELGDDLLDVLDGDAARLADTIGVEGLLKLWKNFSSLSFYISSKPQMEAKRRYVRMKHNGNNTKELALKLSVSERFVQIAVKEGRMPQRTLFNLEEE